MAMQEITLQHINRPPTKIVADVQDGLAVHRSINTDGSAGEYSITHVASGFRIIVPQVYAHKDARLIDALALRSVLLEIAPRGFWTQDKTTIASTLGRAYHDSAVSKFKELTLRRDCERAAAKYRRDRASDAVYAAHTRRAAAIRGE